MYHHSGSNEGERAQEYRLPLPLDHGLEGWEGQLEGGQEEVRTTSTIYWEEALTRSSASSTLRSPFPILFPRLLTRNHHPTLLG
jgi:hypothetical protein